LENIVVHFDLPADDVQKAKAFYAKLFDWQFQIVSDSYVSITTGVNSPTGAFVKVDELPTPSVCPYIWTKDIDKILDKVIDQGGRIYQNKTPAQAGFQAVFIDPFGNKIGLYSPPAEDKKAEKKDKAKKAKKTSKKKKK